MQQIKKVLKDHASALLLLFFTWGLYFLLLWPRLISLKPDGLYVGNVFLWGDWPQHIAIASIFAYKSPAVWFAYHPMYAAGKLNYPFLMDFISGMLMRLGIPLTLAFIIPSIVITLALIFGMYALWYTVLKSKVKAFLTISFFFLSSGLGFVNFIKDFFANPSWQTLWYPTQEYSRLESYQWYTGNPILGLLITQRAYLLGLAMTVWILVGFLYVFLKKDIGSKADKIILVICGALAGILPIVHTHLFLVVVLTSAMLSLCLIKKWKMLLWYVVPATIFSVFFHFYFQTGHIENFSQFFVWSPGWTIKGGFERWIEVWLYLWGAMIPLAILGFFLLRKKVPTLTLVFFASFFLLFIITNLVIIQPVTWDNSKIFFWSYFGFGALAAVSLGWLWEHHFEAKALAVILIIILCFTGSLELIRLQRTDKNSYLVTSTEDINLGLQIRQNTDPLAVFLTATTHNHVVMMWDARPIVMGFPVWVSNYGFLAGQTEADVHTMYLGGADTEKLLKKYHVSYVAIGPEELYNFSANQAYFYQNFPVAFSNQNYRIYDVRKIYSP